MRATFASPTFRGLTKRLRSWEVLGKLDLLDLQRAGMSGVILSNGLDVRAAVSWR